MGCDIHMVVQVQTGGKWKTVEKGYNERNYRVFGLLANVRNGYGFAGVKTGECMEWLADPRGFPEDFKVVEECYHKVGFELPYNDPGDKKFFMGDHSHSWLLAEEILDESWQKKTATLCGFIDQKTYRQWKDGVDPFPYSWCGGTSMPTVSEREFLSVPELYPTHYIGCEWQLSYLDAVGRDFREFMEHLAELLSEHGQGNVRVVFGFDS